MRQSCACSLTVRTLGHSTVVMGGVELDHLHHGRKETGKTFLVVVQNKEGPTFQEVLAVLALQKASSSSKIIQTTTPKLSFWPGLCVKAEVGGFQSMKLTISQAGSAPATPNLSSLLPLVAGGGAQHSPSFQMKRNKAEKLQQEEKKRERCL